MNDWLVSAFVGVFQEGSIFSVAIGSIVGREWLSEDCVVFSELVVVEPVVMVSRLVKVVNSRGHEADLKISEGFGFSPATNTDYKCRKINFCKHTKELLCLTQYFVNAQKNLRFIYLIYTRFQMNSITVDCASNYS